MNILTILQAAGAPAQGGGWSMWIMLILIFVVMYTKVMKLLNSVLNASSRRVNLKKW